MNKINYCNSNHMNTTISSKFKIFAKAIFYIGIIVGITILYLYNPEKKGIFPPCPFKYITGLYCPGCGTLRGIHQLLHGNFLKALHMNPLMVLSIPFIVFVKAYEWYHKFIKNNNKRLVFTHNFYIILLTIIFSYWILRNINIYPFTLLAP